MMKRFLTGLTAMTVAAAFLLSAGTLSAQSAKAKTKQVPFATVAVASYDDLVSQASAVGKMIGNDQVPMMIDAMTAEGPAAIVKKSLDTTKPAGMVAFIVDEEPIPVVMLPLNIANVAKEGGDDFPIVDNGDGTYQIEEMVAKQIGDWCFATPDASAFEMCENLNPEQTLGSMAKRYTVSVKLSAAGVPKALKDQLFEAIEAGMTEASKSTGENPLAAMQVKNAERTIAMLKMFVYEANQVLIGLKFNEKENAIEWDFAFTAKPGTQLQSLLTGTTPMPSKTYGIIPANAALGFWQASKMNDVTLQYTKDQLVQSFEALDGLKVAISQAIEKNADAEEAKVGKAIVGKFDAYLQKVKELSLKNLSSETDVAGALLLTPGAPAIISAGVAKDTAAVDELFAEMGNLAKGVMDEIPAPKSDKDKAAFEAFKQALTTETKEIDGIKYQIASFDVAKLPEIPSDAMDMMKKIFGSTVVQAVVATHSADGMVYSAVSADAVKSIQDAAKLVGTQEAPKNVLGGFFIAATPIVTFVDSVVDTVHPDPQVKQILTQILAILEVSPGKDRILITSKPVKDGALTTIQIQEGTLKAIGTGIMMVQMSRMANAGTTSPMGEDAEPVKMTEEEINQLLDTMGLEGEERETFRQELLEGQNEAAPADENAPEAEAAPADENAPEAEAAPADEAAPEAEVAPADENAPEAE